MIYRIEKNADKPAYIQLYYMLREDIVNGTYIYGQRLPSKRLIASETDTSVITAQHCYELLCDEGYCEARQRSGYYVTYTEGELFNGPGKAEENKAIVQSFPDTALYKDEEFSFSVFARTMRKVLSEYGESILKKSENKGLNILREAIAAYLRRSRGIRISPSQLIIGSGAEYLYSLIAQLDLDGKLIAIEDPSYEKIRRVYEANGIECEMLKMGSEGILSNELKKARAKVLHVTPFNSYPSGITASAGKRMEYLRWASLRNGFIVEDDYDSEFTISSKAKDTVFGLDKEGRVIYMNTFSRTIAPSMRIGYMVLPEKMLDEFEKRLGFYSCTVPVFEQYVLAEFIQSGNFERHINRVRRRMRK